VGALASFSEKGLQENRKNVDYYMKNAQKLAVFLKSRGIFFVGGENAPYLWFKIPNERKSWEFFEYILEKCAVVGTPGVGFGAHGEGFFRFSSFAPSHDVEKAISRLEEIF
jgi:LL-diaminopimelate aminotransferase